LQPTLRASRREQARASKHTIPFSLASRHLGPGLARPIQRRFQGGDQGGGENGLGDMAVERAERGIIDADLGSSLIKQRVARRGQGRSGGYRMIVIYRVKDRAVFLRVRKE